MASLISISNGPAKLIFHRDKEQGKCFFSLSATLANQQISSANSNLRWREIIIKVSEKLGEAPPKNVSIWSMPKQ